MTSIKTINREIEKAGYNQARIERMAKRGQLDPKEARDLIAAWDRNITSLEAQRDFMIPAVETNR